MLSKSKECDFFPLYHFLRVALMQIYIKICNFQIGFYFHWIGSARATPLVAEALMRFD